MATVEEMQVKLSLDVNGLRAQVEQAKAQINELGKNVQAQREPVDRLHGSFTKLLGAVAALGLASKAVDFLKESARAATDDAKSHELLAQQLRNSVGANQAMIDSAEKSIKSMETMSAVADDNIRPAFALLARATGDVGQATTLTDLALNVAAGTGKDLQTVAVALAKAHDGNTGALARLGISVKGLTDPMGALQKQFAGAAETAANNDPYAQMALTFDNIKESVGVALLPVLKTFAKWLKDALPDIENFFKDLNDPTTKTGKAWKDMFNIIMGAFDFIRTHLDVLKNLAITFGVIKVAQLAWNAGMIIANGLLPIMTGRMAALDLAMDANPIGAVAAAIVILTAAIIAFNNALSAQNPNNPTNAPKSVAKQATAAGAAAYEAWMKSNPADIQGGMAAAKAAREAVYVNYRRRTGNAQTYGTTTSGGTTTGGTTTGGTTTGGGTSKLPSAYTTFQNSVQAITKSVKTAVASYNTDMAALTQSHANNIASINADFGNRMAQLTQDHLAKIAQIQADGQAKLASIVAQSKALLTDAFKSATSFDVGAIFSASLGSSSGISSTIATQMKNGISTAVTWWGTASTGAAGGGVAGLLDALKTKLTAAKTLADNAGKLAAAGYSQGFIQQVMSQGADVGNTMSQALLSADPAMQKQIQDSFAALDTISQTGVNKLADTIYKTNGLATAELRKMYADTQAETAKALAAENQAYSQAMASLQAELASALAAENQRFEEEQAKLKDTLDQAMADAHDKLVAALKKASSALGGHMTGLKAKFKKDLQELKDAIAEANALLAPKPGSTSSANTNTIDAIMAASGATGISNGAFTYNVNTTAVTTADPNAIATSIVNGIKLNVPLTVPPTLAAQMGVV
jgi:hypothetical protein